MEYFDSHVHLDFDQYKGNIAEILGNANKQGVTRFVNVASSLAGSRSSVKLAGECTGVYAAVGVHPKEIAEASGEVMHELLELSGQPKVVAIGETGLDFFSRNGEQIDKGHQVEFFKKQLVLARQEKLPVIIHCREAFKDIFEILQVYTEEAHGVFHCFSGSLAEAEKIIELGYKISFTANITYGNQASLLKAIKEIPLDQMLIETDSPFMPPQSMRGKVNEPANVVKVAEKISEIKNIKLDEVARITTENALKLFRIEV